MKTMRFVVSVVCRWEFLEIFNLNRFFVRLRTCKLEVLILLSDSLDPEALRLELPI